MTRNTGLTHIARGEDGISTAIWGGYVLKSAFQPIFGFENGRLPIAAFEALIRPFRDERPMSPGQFFRLIPAQDRFAVETLTRTLHLLNAGACLGEGATLFVNFDPSQFCDRALADTALRDMRLILHEAGLDPSRVVCEMTEQLSSSEPTLFAFVDALRAQGFRIAVDDYGADHSDIRRIEQLKPDIVKFDAHWINQLMESGAGFALLKTMVQTFNDKGFRTVFEGIEEDWQLELAEEAGVSMVQGYLLARPQLAPTEFKIFTQSRGGLEQPEPVPAANSKVLPLSVAQPHALAARAAVQSAPASSTRTRSFGRRQVMP